MALVGNIFLMSKIKNNSIKIQNMGCYPCTQDVYKVECKKVYVENSNYQEKLKKSEEAVDLAAYPQYVRITEE